MATRYWRGNTGYYDDTNHWAATAGGAVGASVPGPTDNVIFDENSFTLADQVVTLRCLAIPHVCQCYDFDCSAVTNRPTLRMSQFFQISGSIISNVANPMDIDKDPAVDNVSIDMVGTVNATCDLSGWNFADIAWGAGRIMLAKTSTGMTTLLSDIHAPIILLQNVDMNGFDVYSNSFDLRTNLTLSGNLYIGDEFTVGSGWGPRLTTSVDSVITGDGMIIVNAAASISFDPRTTPPALSEIDAFADLYLQGPFNIANLYVGPGVDIEVFRDYNDHYIGSIYAPGTLEQPTGLRSSDQYAVYITIDAAQVYYMAVKNINNNGNSVPIDNMTGGVDEGGNIGWTFPEDSSSSSSFSSSSSSSDSNYSSSSSSSISSEGLVPTDMLYATLYHASEGIPNGLEVVSDNIIPASSLGEEFTQEVEFTFKNSPYYLNPAYGYSLVIYRSDISGNAVSVYQSRLGSGESEGNSAEYYNGTLDQWYLNGAMWMEQEYANPDYFQDTRPAKATAVRFGNAYAYPWSVDSDHQIAVSPEKVIYIQANRITEDAIFLGIGRSFDASKTFEYQDLDFDFDLYTYQTLKIFTAPNDEIIVTVMAQRNSDYLNGMFVFHGTWDNLIMEEFCAFEEGYQSGTKVAVDSDGGMHLVMLFSSDGDLYLDYYSWSAENGLADYQEITNVSSDTDMYFKIAIDSNNDLHLVYTNHVTNGYGTCYVNAVKRTSGIWGSSWQVTNFSDNGDQVITGIAIDLLNDLPVIALQNKDGQINVLKITIEGDNYESGTVYALIYGDYYDQPDPTEYFNKVSIVVHDSNDIRIGYVVIMNGYQQDTEIQFTSAKICTAQIKFGNGGESYPVTIGHWHETLSSDFEMAKLDERDVILWSEINMLDPEELSCKEWAAVTELPENYEPFENYRIPGAVQISDMAGIYSKGHVVYSNGYYYTVYHYSEKDTEEEYLRLERSADGVNWESQDLDFDFETYEIDIDPVLAVASDGTIYVMTSDETYLYEGGEYIYVYYNFFFHGLWDSIELETIQAESDINSYYLVVDSDDILHCLEGSDSLTLNGDRIVETKYVPGVGFLSPETIYEDEFAELYIEEAKIIDDNIHLIFDSYGMDKDTGEWVENVGYFSQTDRQWNSPETVGSFDADRFNGAALEVAPDGTVYIGAITYTELVVWEMTESGPVEIYSIDAPKDFEESYQAFTTIALAYVNSELVLQYSYNDIILDPVMGYYTAQRSVCRKYINGEWEDFDDPLIELWESAAGISMELVNVGATFAMFWSTCYTLDTDYPYQYWSYVYQSSSSSSSSTSSSSSSMSSSSRARVYGTGAFDMHNGGFEFPNGIE